MCRLQNESISWTKRGLWNRFPKFTLLRRRNGPNGAFSFVWRNAVVSIYWHHLTKQVQFSKANMLEWSSQDLNHYKMVRISKALLKEAGTGLSKTLSEILVCPLTKQPLRYFFFLLGRKYWYSWFANCYNWLFLFVHARVCEETNSLISDSIGVSFPVSCYLILF